MADLYAGLDTQFVFTDPTSAELIKYAANGFLAMKISFINSVAALCEHVDADVASVVAGIGSDRRIGNAFLNPGPGWGGSCFPKDSRALVSTAAQYGYDFSLMRGVIDINEQQYERMVDKVVRAAGRSGRNLDEVVIGVLGLTFKAGTDDLRESPSLRVIVDAPPARRRRAGLRPDRLRRAHAAAARSPGRHRAAAVGARRGGRRRCRRRVHRVA